MSDPDLVARALAVVPDRARWVEARALLLSDHASVFDGGSGYVIRNDAPGGSVVVIVGRPEPGLLLEALSDRPGRDLICAPEEEEHVARHLPAATRERGLLYELADSDSLAPEDPCVRLLVADDSLAHLPAALRDELDRDRPGSELWTAFVEGTPASFAYAYWRTEGQFDISIDTAPDFRRRGLARLTASALIRAEMSHGRRPVWGAMASNLASQRLAGSLGFTLADEIVVFTPSDPAPSTDPASA